MRSAPQFRSREPPQAWCRAAPKLFAIDRADACGPRSVDEERNLRAKASLSACCGSGRWNVISGAAETFGSREGHLSEARAMLCTTIDLVS